jgi:3-oxoadipate enol-lactonase
MRVHRVEDGPADGPVVLLSSSLGATTDMWAPQVPALAERMRVVRYDHRGHGRSPVADGAATIEDLGGDVVELLDDLGAERASFAGISMGGAVGMWLAINAPDRIDRLVLISTAPHFPPPEQWQQRIAAVRDAGTTAALADAVADRWLTPDYAQAHPAEREALRSQIAGTPADGYVACCEALAALDLRDDLESITAPTLVIGARDDPSTPPDRAEALAQAIPGARLELLAPGAHLVSVEQAERVNALLVDHFSA